MGHGGATIASKGAEYSRHQPAMMFAGAAQVGLGNATHHSRTPSMTTEARTALSARRWKEEEFVGSHE
jgi:hypothetical protein